MSGAALLAYEDWSRLIEDEVSNDFSAIDDADIIIDALFGTGLQREIVSPWSDLVESINKSAKPVISIDIPSGLYADTGALAGIAVQASITVCFIGLKQGMFTAQGKDVCGEIVFNDLGLSEGAYSSIKYDAQLITEINYSLLPKRKSSSHKGCFGHVLIVGGNKGMPGAVILSARAALRTGAGLVTIITVAENFEAISSAVPEAMLKVCDVDSAEALFKEDFIREITHIAIGMGLGQDSWSKNILQQCLSLNKPLLIDADGLNLMAGPSLRVTSPLKVTSPLIITPHPGEASRLLSGISSTKQEKMSSAVIQSSRFDAAKRLHALFSEAESCTVVLKGSGTLIFDGEVCKVCNLGNPAMAAPGMGDVLSGIIIALMAQSYNNTKISLSDVAELGVCLHAKAAALHTGDSTRGLLASDVIAKLPEVLQ